MPLFNQIFWVHFGQTPPFVSLLVSLEKLLNVFWLLPSFPLPATFVTPLLHFRTKPGQGIRFYWSMTTIAFFRNIGRNLYRLVRRARCPLTLILFPLV